MSWPVYVAWRIARALTSPIWVPVMFVLCCIALVAVVVSDACSNTWARWKREWHYREGARKEKSK